MDCEPKPRYWGDLYLERHLLGKKQAANEAARQDLGKKTLRRETMEMGGEKEPVTKTLPVTMGPRRPAVAVKKRHIYK